MTTKPRAAIQLAHASAMRATGELVDRLQAQLAAERTQNRFNMAEMEKQVAVLLREVAELRYELAQRDTRDVLAAASSPSAAVH